VAYLRNGSHMATVFLIKQSTNKKQNGETMNDEHEQILMECWRQMDVHAKSERPPEWKSLDNQDYDETTKFGPAYAAGEWFGEIKNHTRQRLLRAISDLESGGLLVIHRKWGRRLSNIRLTPAGQKIAEELLEKVSL
jgi:hypothetical protein